MAKRKASYSKHDLRRAMENTRTIVSMLSQRLFNLERVVQLYVEMNKDDKKFEKFLDGKSKEKDKLDGKSRKK